MQERNYFIKSARELLKNSADMTRGQQAIIVELYCKSLGIGVDGERVTADSLNS